MFEKYQNLLKRIIPGISNDNLNAKFFEVNIDSLDLVVIRAEFEKYFCYDVSDEIWYNFSSIFEILDFFDKKSDEYRYKKYEEKIIETTNSYQINMPQMCNRALSENWLLKEFGNIHWNMLGQGLNTKSSDLVDNTGNRLYATFIRIRFESAPLCSYKENETLTLNSTLSRFGNNIYLSAITGNCFENKIEATCLTSFTKKQSSCDNSSMYKCDPVEKVNYIPSLSVAPDFFSEYNLLKKEFLEEIKVKTWIFKISNNVLFSYKYSINKYYDINGVGLLYFSSYPIMADICFDNYLIEIDDTNEYYTRFRDVFYFSNCNKNDTIVVNLMDFLYLDTKTIQYSCNLIRGSDGIIIAKIFTVKSS